MATPTLCRFFGWGGAGAGFLVHATLDVVRDVGKRGVSELVQVGALTVQMQLLPSPTDLNPVQPGYVHGTARHHADKLHTGLAEVR